MIFLHPLFPSPQHWRLLILLGLMVLVLSVVKTQDIHSSINTELPTDLGIQFGQLAQEQSSIYGRFRNQWQQIPNAYQTAQLGFSQRTGQWTWGTQLYQQTAGSTGWHCLKLSAALAYQQHLSARGSALLLAVENGLMQHRLEHTQTYDQQYIDGQGFDPTLSNGESALTGSATHFDWSASFGLLSDWLTPGLRKWALGVTAAHLHRPQIMFEGTPRYWEPRWTLQGAYTWPLTNSLFLQGQFIYQQQGSQQELQAGGRLGIAMPNSARLWLGMAYRAADALIVKAAWEEEHVQVWLTFDHVTSPLAKADSRGVGTFELGASYCWNNKSKPKKAKPEATMSPTVPVVQEIVDSDLDGIPDEIDKCPLIVGLAIFQGCNDKDQDGVIDPHDSCPEVFGSRDRNGCPWTEKDADLDGVPDSADYCVFIKGLPSLNGCPDTDQDGVSDIDDKCPYLKGDRSTNGCPKPSLSLQEPMESLSEPDQVQEIIVEFDTDQAIIVPTFQALLQDFSRRYTSQSGLRVFIAGHTDYEGAATYNVKLGQRRAEAVRSYLQALLRTDTHFELLSYGELMPIDSNYSVDGRARNRRAEVRILLDQ